MPWSLPYPERDSMRKTISLSLVPRPPAWYAVRGTQPGGPAKTWPTLPLTRNRRRSSEDLIDNFAMYVGQSKVSALESERQFRVVQTEQMEDRGLQVVYVNAIFNNG